jgi:hypothetical protein
MATFAMGNRYGMEWVQMKEEGMEGQWRGREKITMEQLDEVLHVQGHHQAKDYLIILTIYCRKSPDISLLQKPALREYLLQYQDRPHQTGRFLPPCTLQLGWTLCMADGISEIRDKLKDG